VMKRASQICDQQFCYKELSNERWATLVIYMVQIWFAIYLLMSWVSILGPRIRLSVFLHCAIFSLMIWLTRSSISHQRNFIKQTAKCNIFYMPCNQIITRQFLDQSYDYKHLIATRVFMRSPGDVIMERVRRAVVMDMECALSWIERGSGRIAHSRRLTLAMHETKKALISAALE
jgi:hypothetical protein